MVTYREAVFDDSEAIAQLHSLSWQQNYRGDLSDSFLAGPVLDNRRDVWKRRLAQPTANQHIILAESDEIVCGFICAYANHDPVWGTLIDNLHVRKDQKGQGIGRVLIQSAAAWAHQKNSEIGLYLWVLVNNTSAQKFYNRMGGYNQELASLENPDGTFSDCYRYVWPDIKTLL